MQNTDVVSKWKNKKGNCYSTKDFNKAIFSTDGTHPAYEYNQIKKLKPDTIFKP